MSKSINYLACGNYLIVKLPERTTKTKGGLHLPDTAQAESTFGTIVSVGPKVNELNPGDVVFFNSYSHKTLGDESEGLAVLEDKSIFARAL
jgi:co-chaperonin GroES (HSP10)